MSVALPGSAVVSSTQDVLVAIWERVLGQGPIGPDGDLFALGGSWFDAARASWLVRDALAVDLAPSELAAAPSPAALAGLVEQRRRDSAGPAPPAPAAVSQEGMVWHEWLVPGSFNLAPLVRRQRGRLDVAALTAAFEGLVARHEPLRTTFTVHQGRAVQHVGEPAAVALPLVDLADLPPDVAEAQARQLIDDAASRPFDLARDALFAPSLVRLGPDDHLLVVRLHHTVFDDWSVNVYRRELSALYAAALAREPASLPPLPLGFSEFARRQHRRLAGPAGAAELTWWREQLAGAPLTTALDVAGPAGERPAGPSRPVSLALAPELVDRLRALARHGRSTLFMTLLAGFALLLHRRTGQDDLVIASVVAARTDRQSEGLIGCFTKKVLLRLRRTGDPTFLELMVVVRDVLLGALAHQELGYETVLQETLGQAAARHGVAPHVPIMFQGLVPASTQLDLPGLSASAFGSAETQGPGLHVVTRESRQESRQEPVTAAWGQGLYPGTFLGVSVLDDGQRVTLLAQGGFHRPTVEALMAQFEALLAEVVATPLAPLASAVGTSSAAGSGQRFRGFALDRPRIEQVLAGCPGVRAASLVEAASEPTGPAGTRLVARVVAEPGRAPTLRELRSCLWNELPGSIWPAELLVDDVAAESPGPSGAPSEQEMALRTAWAEVLGVPEVGGGANYWHSFSFLSALACAKERGLAVRPEQVARNRTLETLAADVAATGVTGGAPDRPGTRPHTRSVGVVDPAVANPAMANPAVANPAVANPAMANPAVANPAMANPAVANPTMANPAVVDPPVLGPAEASHQVRRAEVIRAEGLSKVYPGGLAAVDDLDLSVCQGEVFGLLGPNGAGKTTTVGMLTTLIAPSGGRAYVGGVDVVADPALAKQYLGVVPQANDLDNGLTVFENLYFHGRYFGMGAKAARAAAERMLERFRLAGRGHDRVEHLSGGMARRLQLARALMHGPAVAFLDEPTAGLDPQSRLALWDIVAGLRAEGQTVLLTTHYMEEADRFCDRVAIMDHGRILALDTPERLKHSLGSTALMVVRGSGELDGFARRLAALDWVRAAEPAQDAVRIRLDSLEGVLSRVMAVAEQSGVKVSDVSVSEDSLETVFIDLTGRELRE